MFGVGHIIDYLLYQIMNYDSTFVTHHLKRTTNFCWRSFQTKSFNSDQSLLQIYSEFEVFLAHCLGGSVLFD